MFFFFFFFFFLGRGGGGGEGVVGRGWLTPTILLGLWLSRRSTISAASATEAGESAMNNANIVNNPDGKLFNNDHSIG